MRQLLFFKAFLSILILLGCAYFTSAQTNQAFSYLALGDSYTIGESVKETNRWPMLLKEGLNALEVNHKIKDVEIVAKTGWTTQELTENLNKIDLKNNYDLVSLLIGVNNQYRKYPVEDYPDEFTKLLDRAIAYADGDEGKVFVVSIPDYGCTPFGEDDKERISQEIDEYNEINEQISKSKGVQYFYITDISRNGLDNADLVAEDNLHPSGQQYKLWVKRMLEDKELLKRFQYRLLKLF